MNLPKRDVRHFYRLYYSLLFYNNKEFNSQERRGQISLTAVSENFDEKSK